MDTNLTPELIEEGFVREIISKVQTMRKEAGFEVTDRIDVTYRPPRELAAIASRGAEEISVAVLAESLDGGRARSRTAYAKEWNINGEKASLSVRVHNA